MCVVTSLYRLRRTIVTPIGSQAEYDEVDRLCLSLSYWRYVLPPAPEWDELLKLWEEGEDDVINALCCPWRLLVVLGHVLGLLLTPLLSLVLLLFAPLVWACGYNPCTNGFQPGAQLYYELVLESAAMYPITYATLEDSTARVMRWLAAHGVAAHDCMVVDGLDEVTNGCKRVLPARAPCSPEIVRSFHTQSAAGGDAGPGGAAAMTPPLQSVHVDVRGVALQHIRPQPQGAQSAADNVTAALLPNAAH